MAAHVHPEFRFYGSASMGVCYLCHMSRRPADSVVDLGVEVDTNSGTGSLQFCSTCVQHLGRMVGMVSDDDVRDQAAQLVGAVEMCRETMERAEAAEEALIALRRVDAAKPRARKA